MKQIVKFNYPKFLLSVFFLLSVNIYMPKVSAQDDDTPADVAPPPLKILSKEEKKTLEALSDVKKRVRISLELMDARLLRAEKFKTDESFKESLDELSGFNAILDDTLNFLVKSDTGGDKIDKRFITFEIYLRKQIPRIEVIRRELPSRYGYHVGNIMKAVREARAKAVEPLFGDSVVPTKKPDEKN